MRASNRCQRAEVRPWSRVLACGDPPPPHSAYSPANAALRTRAIDRHGHICVPPKERRSHPPCNVGVRWVSMNEDFSDGTVENHHQLASTPRWVAESFRRDPALEPTFAS